jgi:hypothetical protein
MSPGEANLSQQQLEHAISRELGHTGHSPFLDDNGQRNFH